MAVQCKSWFDILNLKQIRCCLLNSSKENYSKDSNSEAKRLMTIWNGNIFVWDSKAANIIHSKMNDCQNADNEMYKHTQYQVRHGICVLNVLCEWFTLSHYRLNGK